jgi:hypothetical protein
VVLHSVVTITYTTNATYCAMFICQTGHVQLHSMPRAVCSTLGVQDTPLLMAR